MNPLPIKLTCIIALVWTTEVFGQAAIQNPLIKPTWANGAGQPGAATAAPAGANQQAARGQEPAASAPGGASPGGDDVRDRAAARLTQEDFNIRQQTLNATNVPAPLIALFSQMAVSAHVSGAVVLRRPDSMAFTAPVQTSSGGGAAAGATGTGNNGQVAANARVAQAPAAPQASVAQGPSVLRLKVGRPVNISGYTLKAKVEDFDVTVEWQNEQGRWVTVFFGAVESAPAFSLVPVELEKTDTKAFDYLVPATSTRLLNSGIAGGGGAGGGLGGGGFGGGGFGGAQPGGQQPGFGSTGTAFR